MQKGKRHLALKCAALAASVVFTFGYVFGAAAMKAPPEPAQAKKVARPTPSQTLQQGRAVYVANCARCHGGDGLGKTTLGLSVEAPDMTDTRWQSRRGVRRMTQSVVRGRGQMPAFGGKLTREEIAAAIAYVRALRK
jgi:mono/diheme cytochrome c family protein